MFLLFFFSQEYTSYNALHSPFIMKRLSVADFPVAASFPGSLSLGPTLLPVWEGHGPEECAASLFPLGEEEDVNAAARSK